MSVYNHGGGEGGRKGTGKEGGEKKVKGRGKEGKAHLCELVKFLPWLSRLWTCDLCRPTPESRGVKVRRFRRQC